MSDKFILGLFTDEDKLVHAAQILKEKGIEIYDIFTPFPLHGLDDVLGIKRSKLPWVTFGAGLAGLILAMWFEVWTSATDWPINVGGKPLLSIPAFIPVAFEVTVLFGALATVFAFFYVGKLFPGKKVRLMDYRQTDDQFVLALARGTGEIDIIKMEKFFKEHGATEVKLID